MGLCICALLVSLLSACATVSTSYKTADGMEAHVKYMRLFTQYEAAYTHTPEGSRTINIGATSQTQVIDTLLKALIATRTPTQGTP